ncbi:uncharacterized protein AB675_9632 [Cyphellophora attinorum]|uniref:Beta-1,4-mannosyl-glycoprotein 4-beta-N-acetylglucosaminyltransferase n=1 Tax=Cyphellophora attinorum TaxID=1664694 RepID=A0A0N1P2E5_9EURO|nr:uncharacterized protein AB675_9632 [Phialophora attinorum]KPI42312.1 hypothetical protein AB675_9632 [Phialophora attinorum]
MASASLNSSQAGRISIAIVAAIILLKLFFLPSSSAPSHSTVSTSYSSRHTSWRPSLSKLKLPSWSKSTEKLTSLGFLPLSPAVESLCAHYRWVPFADRYHRRKIYDFVVIHDVSELETLGLRMAEMGDGVDWFVVIERAVGNGEGGESVRYVSENMGMFEKASREKMVVAVLNETHVPSSSLGERLEGDRLRDAIARDAALEQVLPVLQDEMIPTHGDILISGDVDEIIRPEVLTAMRNCDMPAHVRLWTRGYFYSFQWLVGGIGSGSSGDAGQASVTDGGEPAYEQQHHLDATIFTGFKSTLRPSVIRDSNQKPNTNIHAAGWRCRFCFSSIQDIISNIASGTSAASSAPEDLVGVGAVIDPVQILQRVRAGFDITGRERELYRVDNNKDVPGAVVRDGAKYGYMLDRDAEDGNFVDAWEVMELYEQKGAS